VCSIMMKSIQTLWYVIPAIASENPSENIHHTREAGSRLVGMGYALYYPSNAETDSLGSQIDRVIYEEFTPQKHVSDPVAQLPPFEEVR
jgi:hypothetical protein